MTLLAFFATRECIVAASDSASLPRNGSAAQHFPKLQANALARSVCAGTGIDCVLAPAYAVCADASSFDGAVSKITRALRRGAHEQQKVFDGEKLNSFAAHTFVWAGWSEESARMLAYVFTGWAYFTPVLTSSLVLPEVEGLPELWRPRTLDDMVRLCRQQADILVSADPRAGAGSLMTAEMTEHRITLVSVPDYHTGDKECLSTAS